ncbi:MAG: hypothetical protein U5L45_24260 [Saprospiraceae bacterium]|nr:hypothetical protein [Saprospiraceae bacterium]
MLFSVKKFETIHKFKIRIKRHFCASEASARTSSLDFMYGFKLKNIDV